MKYYNKIPKDLLDELFICDIRKNKNCPKDACYINDGPCYCVTKDTEVTYRAHGLAKLKVLITLNYKNVLYALTKKEKH